MYIHIYLSICIQYIYIYIYFYGIPSVSIVYFGVSGIASGGKRITSCCSVYYSGESES
jgi:hypothetical protein